MTKRTTWKPEEDDLLRQMVKTGLTHIEMGRLLNRSPKGCGDRIRTLGIEGARGRPARISHAAIAEPAMSPFDRMIETGSKRLLERLVERGYWREAA